MRPRSRCDPCAKRHAKCGGQRPRCRQCEMHGFKCTWDGKNEKSVRKSKIKGVVECAGSEAAETILDFETLSLDGDSDGVQPTPTRERHALIHTSAHIQTLLQPNMPLVTLAISKYTKRYLHDRSSPDFDPEAFLMDTPNIYASVLRQPQTELAKTAVALAYFGRTENAPAAVAESYEWYNQALVFIKSAICGDPKDVSDDTMLMIMLLYKYESFMGTQFQRMPSPYRHSLGAASLIPLRQAQTNRSYQSVALDNLVRRSAIRAAINTGTTVPQFLRDVTAFPESVMFRKLNLYLLDLMDIWTWTKEIEEKDPGFGRECAYAAVLQSAVDLEAKFAAMGRELEEQGDQVAREYEPHFLSDLLPGTPRLYGYKDMYSSVVWNNYLGARIRLTDIMIRASFLSKQAIPKNTSLSRAKASKDFFAADTEHSPQVVENMRTLSGFVAHVFATIPWYFGVPDLKIDSVEEACRRSRPTTTTKSIFPLVSISATFAVPLEDRLRAKEVLELVGRVSGSVILNNMYCKSGPLGGDWSL